MEELENITAEHFDSSFSNQSISELLEKIKEALNRRGESNLLTGKYEIDTISIFLSIENLSQDDCYLLYPENSTPLKLDPAQTQNDQFIKYGFANGTMDLFEDDKSNSRKCIIFDLEEYEGVRALMTFTFQDEAFISKDTGQAGRFFKRMGTHIFKDLSIAIFNEFRYMVGEQKHLIRERRQYQYSMQIRYAIHSIRNKLGPIKTQLEVLGEIPEDLAMTPKTKRKWDLAKANNSSILDSLDNTNKYADTILDDKRNRFSSEVAESLPWQKVYKDARTIALTYNNEATDGCMNVNFKVGLAIPSLDAIRSRRVCIRPLTNNLLLDNWVSNMRKFSKTYAVIKIVFEGEGLALSLRNDCSSSDRKSVALLKSILEGSTGNESSKTTTSTGLTHVKDAVSCMELDAELRIVDNNVELKLFYRYEEESSSDRKRAARN